MNRVIAVIVAILLGATAFAGYHTGRTYERALWLSIENSTLREQAKEVTRQIEKVAAKQREYNDAQTKINDISVRLRASDRMRIKAEHATSVQRANTESLRAYAGGLFDLYETCRKEYIELGLEAARAASISGAIE